MDIISSNREIKLSLMYVVVVPPVNNLKFKFEVSIKKHYQVIANKTTNYVNSSIWQFM